MVREQNNVDEARELFRSIAPAAAEVPKIAQACMYELAWCDYLQHKFELAAGQFVAFLAVFRGVDYRAYASYQLGARGGEDLFLLTRQTALNKIRIPGMALSEIGQHERANDAFAAVQGLARPHFSFDDVCYACLGASPLS